MELQLAGFARSRAATGVENMQSAHGQIINLEGAHPCFADHQTTDCKGAKSGYAKRQCTDSQCPTRRCFRSQMSGRDRPLLQVPLCDAWRHRRVTDGIDKSSNRDELSRQRFTQLRM